jgi:hypothetical protein
MVIRPPRWFMALCGGLFVGSVLLVLISILVGLIAFAFPFGGVALASAAIALMLITRRLELRGDRLIAVLITGEDDCPVADIASMRRSPAGNGLSRCAFIRQDGSQAFGKLAVLGRPLSCCSSQKESVSQCNQRDYTEREPSTDRRNPRVEPMPNADGPFTDQKVLAVALKPLDGRYCG